MTPGELINERIESFEIAGDLAEEQGEDPTPWRLGAIAYIGIRGIGSSGIGDGSGSGIGDGRGSDDKDIKPNPIQDRETMQIGKNYLIHCGDWHTFVGRFEGFVSPILGKFSNVSKIANTNNGDCWEDLCAGDIDARKKATYKRYPTPLCCPIAIGCFEWVGDLP